MRPGALAVLFLLAVTTSLSEGRNVSICDLKEGIEKYAPWWWKPFMTIKVICHVNMLSGLNTALVRKCPRPAVSTTAPVLTVVPTDGPTASEAPREFTRGAPLQPDNPAPPKVKGKERRGREAEQGTDAPQSEESYEEEEEIKEEGDEEEMQEEEEEIKEEEMQEEGDEEEMQEEMQEEGDEEEMQEEMQEEEEEEEIQEEGDEEVEDDIEGDGGNNNMLSKRKRRSVPPRCRPGSGFYGIFQLSDRIFCDSGENPTKNLCRTKCSAFTDDDITDDLRCFFRRSYWRKLYYRRLPHRFWKLVKIFRKVRSCQ